jgi:hypothetical protein
MVTWILELGDIPLADEEDSPVDQQTGEALEMHEKVLEKANVNRCQVHFGGALSNFYAGLSNASSFYVSKAALVVDANLEDFFQTTFRTILKERLKPPTSSDVLEVINDFCSQALSLAQTQDHGACWELELEKYVLVPAGRDDMETD